VRKPEEDFVRILIPLVALACAAAFMACTGETAGPDAAVSDDGGTGLIDDGGDPTDSGAIDSSTPDAGDRDDAGASDAGLDDAGLDDAGLEDAGLDDAGLEDAGLDDAGLDDAGLDDAGLEDAGLDDAGLGDAGGPGGCEPTTTLAPPVETSLSTLDLSTTGVVRAVWFTPADRDFAPGLRERLDRLLDVTEEFFRDEMSLYGELNEAGAGRTLERARAADGRWDIVFMRGEQPSSFYHAHPNASDAPGEALREMFIRLPPSFHHDATVIYFYDTFIVDGDALLHTGQAGSAAPWQGANAGYALIGSHVLGAGFSTIALEPAAQGCLFDDQVPSGLSDFMPEGGFGLLSRGAWSSVFVGAVVHEIGHAYGLEHDFVDYDGDFVETNVMGNGFRRFGARFTTSIPAPATMLGPFSAAQLALHPWIR